MTACSATHRESSHLGGRGRGTVTSLGPVWFLELVPIQPWLQSKTLFQKGKMKRGIERRRGKEEGDKGGGTQGGKEGGRLIFQVYTDKRARRS